MSNLKCQMENGFCRTLNVRQHHFSGGCVERATPVPIPNTEVKPLGADGTARATAWESRKPPGLLVAKPAELKRSAGFRAFCTDFLWFLARKNLFIVGRQIGKIAAMWCPRCKSPRIQR